MNVSSFYFIDLPFSSNQLPPPSEVRPLPSVHLCQTHPYRHSQRVSTDQGASSLLAIPQYQKGAMQAFGGSGQEETSIALPTCKPVNSNKQMFMGTRVVPMGVTNCFLLGFKDCSIGGNPCLVQSDQEPHQLMGTMDEPTTIVFLSEHCIKLPSELVYLYPQVSSQALSEKFLSAVEGA